MNDSNNNESQSKIQNGSSTVGILTGIAGILTALATLLTSINAPEFLPTVVKKLMGTKAENQTEAIILRGDFRQYEKDEDKPGHYKQLIATEKVELTFLGTKKHVTGQSEFMRLNLPGKQKRTWELSGYSHNEYLVLAYNRIEDDLGIGTYFLEKYGSKGDTYLGYRKGYDLDLKKIVICPYVLSNDNSESFNKVRNKHLDISCEEVDLRFQSQKSQN